MPSRILRKSTHHFIPFLIKLFVKIIEYSKNKNNKNVHIIIVIKLMHDISRHIVYTWKSKALSSFLKKEGVIWKMWRLIPLHTNKKKRVRPSHFLYPNYTFVLCVHWPLLLIGKSELKTSMQYLKLHAYQYSFVSFPSCQKCFPPLHLLIFRLLILFYGLRYISKW